MNRAAPVFLVFLIIFCASCAQKEGRSLLFWQASPEQRLFEQAEQQYAAGHYNEALVLYQEYLSQFPDTDLTPAALLKMGMIRADLEQYEEALRIFSRVLELYPKTLYAVEADIGKLAVYYKTGEYQQVTVYTGNVLAKPLSREQLIRVNFIVGDSYLAIKSPIDAYYAYLSAFRAAKADEKRKVIPRLQTALALMDPSDLTKELEKLEGRPPAGYLLYQLGIAYMDAGIAGEAVTTFSSFLEEFPSHEYAGQAQKFIADLEASAITDRHLIGCLLPLTGKYEKFGQQALEGIEFALSEFARSRGIYSIRLLIKDTASDSAMARQGLFELAENNVSAVIGPIATVEDVSVQAQELRIPMIVLTQKPGITGAGDYIFRNFLTPGMQIKTLVSYVAESLDAKRFAILYPAESYGDIYMNLFWDEVLATGGRVVGVEAYDPAKTDFADTIKKLVGLYYDIPEDLVEEPFTTPMVFNESAYPAAPMAPDVSDILTVYDAGAWDDELLELLMLTQQAAEKKQAEEADPEPIVDFDAVFIPDSPNKAGLILPQLAYYDINDVRLLGTNLWHSDKLIDMAKYHIQGAIVPEGFFEESRAEHVHRFVTGFKYTYNGKRPGFIEAVSYDTAWILFDLVSRPDIRFRAQIKKELYAMPPFLGVTGTTMFDADGEAVKDIYLLKVRGRRFVEIAKKGILP